MAKKKNIPQPPPLKPKITPLFNFTSQVKYTILLVLGFFLYVNTLQNQYALDDAGVILTNRYVQQGISGIPKILSSDAFASYLEQMHAGQHLSGGRYRPLSIAVFAIVQSIFGSSPFIGHLLNLACFLATIAAIFYFLSKYLLKNLQYGEDMAFVSAILFAIHPIHTEVVANIKSLDEILSLLFILCTFIFGLKYIEEKQKKHLVISLIAYFFALLSKEYGMTLLLLLPILFYLSPSVEKGKTLNYFLPYLGVFFLYLFMRVAAVGLPHGEDPNVRLLNNQLRVDPYYFATHSQKLATEWYCLGKYLFMEFVPYPLSSDYSYAQIPYHNFSDISVWISILLYIGIIIWGIQLLRKKSILAFPVFFYLFNLALVSNFALNVGAMLGERFAYHSSLGFVILISYGIFYLLRKSTAQTKKAAITATLGVLTLLCGAEVVMRNADWKNNDTLFLADLKTAPNSSFVNNNAGACLINIAQKPENSAHGKELLDSAVHCLYKAIHFDKTFPDPYINLGLAYYCLNQQDSAKHYWDMVQYGLYPNHPNLLRYRPMLAKAYLNKAMALGQSGQTAIAIDDMKKGISEDSTNAEIWYNLGGAYFTIKQYDSARYAWTKAVQLKQDYTEAINGLRALSKNTNTK